MPKFEVRIKERCIRHAVEEIEADDWEQAEMIAQQMYGDDKLDFEFEAEEIEDV